MITGKSQVVLALVCGLTIISGCSSSRDDKYAATSSGSISTGQIHYSYDALGRLIHAASADGSGVHYNYDAVGNITAIRRAVAGMLSIVDFAPATGPIGTTVTVFGSGFDPTAAQNAVTFNGTAAVVTAATATTLTVTVPGGATSGKIAVVNAAGSATSAADFVVSGVSSAPVIAGFTPQVGTLNTVVTLTGTNFQASADDDKVAVAGQLAVVVQDASSPTVTQLKFRVPSATASGLISLTTQFGKAVSATEFFAVPTTVNPADVEFTGRLSVNGPAAAVTTTANGKKAVLLFDGVAGQGLHLRTQLGSFASGMTADVYAPTGSKVETLSLTNSSLADFAKPAPLNGTYSVILSPAASDKGSVQLSLIGDVNGPIALDSSMPVSLGAGQNGRFTFTGQAGKGYGLAVTGLSFTPPSGGSMQAVLRKTDGTFLTNCPLNTSGSCDLSPALFATSGTYLMDFDPGGLNAASFNAVLSTDASGTIALDSAPAAVTIARPGQNARYSFSGTAGQLVSVVLTGNALDDGNPGTNNTTAVSVFKPSSPNGTAIGGGGITTNASTLTVDVTLPETGSYTLLIAPVGLDAGSINAQVKSYVTGPLAVDGTTPVNLGAGQNARFTFTGQAGTGYGLAVTGLSFTPPSGATMQAVLRKADGTFLTNCPLNTSGSCDLSPTLFTTTGTYLMDFDPGGLNAASFNAVLSTDASGTIALDSAPTAVTIARPGQNARYSFSGTAGQLVSVVLTGNTLDDGNAGTNNPTTVSVFKPSSPNGTAIGGGSITTATAGLAVDVTLPETGSYTLLIAPVGMDSGSINAQVKSYVGGTLAMDGTTPVNLGAGQNARAQAPLQTG